MAFSIQYVSILLEAVIAIFGILIWTQKKKIYGLGFFVTFGIYVFYDFARLLGWAVSESVLYGLFFVASVSALWTAWGVYKSK